MTYRMRATFVGVRPAVTRTFAFPSDITFLDLHLIIQAMAGWGDRYVHCFRAGDRKIGPADHGVAEEADETVSDAETRMSYEYGTYRVDLMFLKGRTEETEKPVILEGQNDFPPDDCRDLDEYLDLLKVMDDPQDPAYPEVSKWMASVSKSQEVAEVNRDFSERWERIGKIAGRVPFNVGATIGALLITGCDGYYYDRTKKRLTENSDGSDNFVPVSLGKDGIVDTLAGTYADMIGLKSDNLLEDLLSDEHRQGWEEYAENFLDEVTDAWADGHGFIVETYAESDISKMMDAFEEEKD